MTDHPPPPPPPPLSQNKKECFRETNSDFLFFIVCLFVYYFWRQGYHYVVQDGPQLLYSSDPLALAPQELGLHMYTRPTCLAREGNSG